MAEYRHTMEERVSEKASAPSIDTFLDPEIAANRRMLSQYPGSEASVAVLKQVLRNQAAQSKQLALILQGQQAAIDLSGVLEKLQILIDQGVKIMATLADLQAEVAAEDTVIDSAIALLDGLAAAVAALEPNQAAIDALAADISAKKQALADSVVKNTPAGP